MLSAFRAGKWVDHLLWDPADSYLQTDIPVIRADGLTGI